MATKIYVNLPVKDLQRSVRFFQGVGFGFNPQLSDESAACMAISDEIFALLLTEARFREIARRPVADTTRTTEVITCLSVESRTRVNQLVDRALAQGGREVREPEDHGFMFGRSFSDLDGHIWEIIYMNQNAMGRV
ncbi:VOC family protein [Microvirga makkahensis]|uniref:Glyoxalase/bleomycin resistance/extradiol dioxygenase family protein n=1 Tax=Microvirga makkahensis TaxID=1128670 RepID=A0A7X3MS03_9HYPH|nr:VOC family protein [Microvirga makkahensis]MXQ12030.1 glyoxalase/bleomycin resistance/extradiol dioxygenase family protein [Microvirga makkahensis]